MRSVGHWRTWASEKLVRVGIGNGVFPFGIDFRFEFVAADEFLEVADDSAPGDTELPRQSGNVGALF